MLSLFGRPGDACRVSFPQQDVISLSLYSLFFMDGNDPRSVTLAYKLPHCNGCGKPCSGRGCRLVVSCNGAPVKQAVLRCSLSVAALLAGCVAERSFKSDIASWVGAPIAQWRWHKGEPARTFVRENGDTVFVYPVKAQDCTIHWNVNRNQLITGYEIVGPECTQMPGST